MPIAFVPYNTKNKKRLSGRVVVIHLSKLLDGEKRIESSNFTVFITIKTLLNNNCSAYELGLKLKFVPFEKQHPKQ